MSVFYRHESANSLTRLAETWGSLFVVIDVRWHVTDFTDVVRLRCVLLFVIRAIVVSMRAACVRVLLWIQPRQV